MQGVTPTEVGVWIGVLILLVPTVKVIADWVRPPSIRISQQPFETKVATEYMSRADCDRMHAETKRFEDQRFTAIDSRLTELVNALDRRNVEGEARALNIHHRVDNVIEAVSELRGKVDTHIAGHGDHRSDR